MTCTFMPCFLCLGVVRLVRLDAVGGDECPVDDDEIAVTEPRQGLVQSGRPGGGDLDRLVEVAPGGRLRDAEPGAGPCRRLVLGQMRQGGQGRIRNQQGPSVAGVSGITTPTTRGPALSYLR